jgi:hypothetical protein
VDTCPRICVAKWPLWEEDEVVVATHKEAEEVLATWREIERRLAAAEPGSREHERLTSDAALLRDRYQQLVEEVRSADEPVFPSSRAEPA